MTLTIFAERDARSGLWQYRCLLAAVPFQDLLDTLHVERSVPFHDLLDTLRVERSVSFQALRMLDSFHVERPVSFQALLCSSARAESIIRRLEF